MVHGRQLYVYLDFNVNNPYNRCVTLASAPPPTTPPFPVDVQGDCPSEEWYSYGRYACTRLPYTLSGMILVYITVGCPLSTQIIAFSVPDVAHAQWDIKCVRQLSSVSGVDR